MDTHKVYIVLRSSNADTLSNSKPCIVISGSRLGRLNKPKSCISIIASTGQSTEIEYNSGTKESVQFRASKAIAVDILSSYFLDALASELSQERFLLLLYASRANSKKLKSPLIEQWLQTSKNYFSQKRGVLSDLFKMMRDSKVGDWELRRFIDANPDCVNWKEPSTGMVPLLYAFYIESRWLVRHFIQLDQSKLYETDIHGFGAVDIATLNLNIGLMAYATRQLSKDALDPKEFPLPLTDCFAGLTGDSSGLLKKAERINHSSNHTLKDGIESSKVAPIPTIT